MEDLSKLKLYEDDNPEADTVIKKGAGRRRGSGKMAALVIAVVIGLVVGFGIGYLTRSGSSTVEVTTDYAVKQSSAKPVVTRRESGWIEVPDDQFPLYITALTTGRLEKVSVRKGMKVVKGQEVAHVYDGYLKIELARAESEFKKAQANYLKMKRGYRKQEVAQAKARADKAMSLVDKAEASLAQAEANLIELQHQVDLANITYVRAIPLVKTKAISQQRLDELRSGFEETKARHAKAAATVKVAEAEIALAKAAYKEADEEHKLMEEGFRSEDIESAEAEMNRLLAERDIAQLHYESRVIRSPWDGVILHQFKHAGDLVGYPGKQDGPNPRIASVYDPSKLQARIQLDFDRVQDISENQGVIITTDVEGSQVTYDGKVVRFDPEADYKNNIVWVKVEILNPSDKLHPEMVCKAQFLAVEQETAVKGEEKEYILIPDEAVVERGSETFVYVVKDGRARSVAVEIGGRVSGRQVVKSGLSGGEEVITGGHASLSDGTPVVKRSTK
ncbi:MAG: efflux RND transporter periplasmic adaptor subunit [Planctomycetota bacterium]|jgi:RND family efflux transporter MFP subunit